MTFFDEYYRAYREFQDKVSPLEEYKKRSEAFEQADLGADMHNGSLSTRVIDMDWVEAIERAIEPLDTVIRESRRFIRTEEEVVPIERSRRITTESVRHLAQHTNMIARVVDDDVTPESILNIRHEESFAIYENRFVVLLIDTAIRFIEQRYKALTDVAEFTLSHICMNRDFSTATENTRFSLDYYTEYSEQHVFDITADISTMSGYERVQRLRTILNSFAATPLIRGLKGVEPVRPPITRTNLLLKNPNFRACLDLWVFLESYTKTGYQTLQSETRGEMEAGFKKEIEGAMDVMQFVVRSYSNPDFAGELQSNYERIKAREAAEAERLEAERQALIEQRIASAVEEERVRQEEVQAQLVQEHEQQVAELNTQKQKELDEQKSDYEKQLLDRQTEHETAMQTEKERFDQAAREHETQKAELTAAHTAALAAEKAHGEELVRGHEQEKLRMNEEFSAAIGAEKQKYIRTVADFDAERRQMEAQNASQIRSVQDECRRDMEKLEQQYVEEKQELDRYHRTLLADKQSSWDETCAIMNDSIRAERRRAEALKNKEAALEQELEAVQQQLDQEKKKSEQLRKESEKTASRAEEKLARAEETYRAKLEKQDKRSQRKVANLERKLKKALAKCPVAEVMAEDIEDTEETADLIESEK